MRRDNSGSRLVRPYQDTPDFETAAGIAFGQIVDALARASAAVSKYQRRGC
jgi:hypothetical protein